MTRKDILDRMRMLCSDLEALDGARLEQGALWYKQPEEQELISLRCEVEAFRAEARKRASHLPRLSADLDRESWTALRAAQLEAAFASASVYLLRALLDSSLVDAISLMRQGRDEADQDLWRAIAIGEWIHGEQS